MCFLNLRKTAYNSSSVFCDTSIALPSAVNHHSLPECFIVLFAWRVFQNIVLCIRLWYQLSSCSLSLDFYLCLFLFVIGVSGQVGQITTVKLCIFSLLFCSFPHSYFNSSFYALCNSAVRSFCKVGIINYVKVLWVRKSLKWHRATLSAPVPSLYLVSRIVKYHSFLAAVIPP